VNVTPYEHSFLLRLSGELSTKSRTTRRRFQRFLVEAIEDALRSAELEFRVRDEWGRVFVEASSGAALDVLSRVFGIASLSPIDATCPSELGAIVEVGERIYADRVRGGTFAVRARRAGTHAFNSRDVNYELGAALNRYAEVDLDEPHVVVGVEVREDATYLFAERVAGAGGLPAGVEGGALALISGGYDSAVAAWMMMKRGVALDYIFCNLAGAAYERAVLAVAKSLTDEWGYGTRPRIHVVDFEEPLRRLRQDVEERFWQVVLKRLMYRVGESVARKIGAHALVTGEAVGQVSSQTLANLAAIDDVTRLPVLRPLVGFDKLEIIERSRAIGTYALSEKVREQFDLWHYPGAHHRDFWEIFSERDPLERERTYVLYCELGLKTAQLAERLQRAGYEAYSFKGGVRALKAQATKRGAQPA
jgi:thiamine biosynthesis protein ThiI